MPGNGGALNESLCAYLIGGLIDGDGAGDLARTAAVHDPAVPDQVTDHAEGVVDGALRFVNDL